MSRVTTLGTLVRRGLIELVDEPEELTKPKLKPRQSLRLSLSSVLRKKRRL